MITIFSRSGCMQCMATERYAASQGIPFVKENIEENPSARQILADQGFSQLPVVKTDAGEWWSGYRPDKLSHLIK